MAPNRVGLYNPAFEHDSCGVAMVVDMHGRRSRDIVDKAITALVNLEHRGAQGAEPHSGDGAGILIQVPDAFLRDVVDFDLPEAGSYATGIAFLPQSSKEAATACAAVEKIVEAGIAATAAETVGAMEAMNEMTLEYSKTRVQFGQPIGSYQVVQHRLADMFMAQEQGRSMAMLATMSVDNTDDAERRHDFALAKVGVGQSGRYVSQSAVQMHGGIGMTEEYAVGHYFRRCMVIERLFGDPAYYLQRLANEID